MYSVKKNVLQVIALLKAFNIKQVVISPGSRNAPLIQCFTLDSFFTCHTVVDERNAAFYALGLMQKLKQPAIICCTSGSAVLNYAPAVSEAFYQQLPLIVLTADRTPEWIGQMDGQTLPQPNIFGSLVKNAINLPEVKSPGDEWYCNRMINDALIACTANEHGPVHINIALSEPLFDYSQKNLPQVRKINFTPAIHQVDLSPFIQQWQQHHKRLIIVGQLSQSDEIATALKHLFQKTDCIIFSEHLSNCNTSAFTQNFDAALAALNKANEAQSNTPYTPDLVVSLGGHIVSKRLKQFLRTHQPVSHWHISLSHHVVDLFQSLTHLIQADTAYFLNNLAQSLPIEKHKNFQTIWKTIEAQIPQPSTDTFSDISVMQRFLYALPENAPLHLANSSIVRNAQLFKLKPGIRIYCNRGTNGIESSMPCAIGYASISQEPVYLAIGDLSFFYTVNALWNIHAIKNLRILLTNNGGGGIFHLLPGLNQSKSLEHVTAQHSTTAKKWAQAAGLSYLSANEMNGLEQALQTFTSPEAQQSMLLEIFTDTEVNKQTFQQYYQNLKLQL